MGAGHDHGSALDARRAGDRVRLRVALCIVVVVLVAEVVGAALTGSLALLADAGHMASDAIGLIVALVASGIAARPATDRHTYGFRRVEVLAALVNGVLLTVLAVTIGIEAIRRLLPAEEAQVDAAPMLAVAILGLVANLVALLVLRGGDRSSLNMRGAILEVVGDLLGSVAAIAAAIVILATGFAGADALASLAIALLIAPRAVLLLRDVMRVLTESAPRETDVQQIRRHIEADPAVVAVHDVHIWTITSGSPVFTAHVVVEPDVLVRGEVGEVLDRLGGCLAGHFDVAHSTFQIEPHGHAEREEHAHR
ncbi:cation diffusion facilitator family transporter [Homoserinibacter sp. GY 40078]|uniref:cation diffusion facilitator family transporter n=1 Tax=Homoserinibacter sp. GY 40078 TaxID=2603275 RepID=UPI0011CB0B1A|nr:cation diffusion facilitator family transporter [Homoserinibacter sp. GY 40078]TXK17138.1 cation transporter [Homoserinibacter sp. GY 40078]